MQKIISTKPILDCCCGSRMFYFDKSDSNVLFTDIRELHETLCDGIYEGAERRYKKLIRT